MNKKLLAIVLALTLALVCASALAAEGDQTEIRDQTVISYVHTSSTEGSYTLSLPADFALAYNASVQAAVGSFQVGVVNVVIGDQTAPVTLTIAPNLGGQLTLKNTTTSDYKLYSYYYMDDTWDETFKSGDAFFTWDTDNREILGENDDYLVSVYLKAPVAATTAVGEYAGHITFNVTYSK